MAHNPKLSLLRWTFLSKYLGRQQEVDLLLPYGCFANAGSSVSRPFKVLWLLHGKTDDYETWLRNSIIEVEARKYQLAVIMPDAGNSFYCDMDEGPDYFSYITEELPTVIRGLLPLSDKREDNFIAGLSMGGYGTMKIALTYPERFAAAGSFSGALDVKQLYNNAMQASLMLTEKEKEVLLEEGYDPDAILFQRIQDKKIMNAVFGRHAEIAGTSNDIFNLIHQVPKEKMPFLYISCGREDPLLPQSEKAVRAFQEANIPVVSEWMEGDHAWSVWNPSIAHFLQLIHDKGLF